MKGELKLFWDYSKSRKNLYKLVVLIQILTSIYCLAQGKFISTMIITAGVVMALVSGYTQYKKVIELLNR